MLQPEPTFRPPSRRGDNDDVERVSAASREVDPATSEAAGHALTAFAAAALELVRGESADAWYRQTIGLSDFAYGDTDGEGDDWLASGGTGAASIGPRIGGARRNCRGR